MCFDLLRWREKLHVVEFGELAVRLDYFKSETKLAKSVYLKQIPVK